MKRSPRVRSDDGQQAPLPRVELGLEAPFEVPVLSLSFGRGEDGWGGVLCGRSRVYKLWPF